MNRHFSFAQILTSAGLLCVALTACSGQELTPPEVASDVHAFASTQTASRRNYALLQPISSRPSALQASSQVQMLEPLNRQDRPAAQNGIVVVPKSFQRKIFDQHQFVVRNEGTKLLRQATVVLTAPVGSTIQQVSPKPDSVSDRKVAVAINGLAPGTEQTIEIAIVYPRNEFARFSSTVENLQWAGVPGQRPSKVAGAGRVLETGQAVAKRSFSMPAVGMLQPRNTDASRSIETMNVAATMDQRILKPTSTVNGKLESGRVRNQAAQNMLTPMSAGVENANAALATENPPLPTGVEAGNTVQVAEPKSKPDRRETAVNSESVSTKINGPIDVVVGVEEEYSVDLRNVSIHAVQNVVVQLSIPEGMKVTVLDREAWYDAENRKLTWKVGSLDIGEVEKIRYKAKILSNCSIEQSATTGIDGAYANQSILQTTAR